MKKSRVAVIQFPGSNCEFETEVALEKCGCEAEIFRWNRDSRELEKFAGYVIGGGFSYQDRIRAGAVAAKEDVMEKILDEAKKGKPVLGICNGAQILVESGMVPGITLGKIEMALSPNKMERDKEIKRTGYYCRWVFLKHKKTNKKSAFSYYLKEEDVFPVPVAHAEGRFFTRDQDTLSQIKEMVLFSYCTPSGEEESVFPTNPNGSVYNSAGIGNVEGNVLALMPHPERAVFWRQIPQDLLGAFGKKRLFSMGKYEKLEKLAPASLIFKSMKRYMEERE